MIVYVLTENEANEGGSVAGVYSSEEKARDEAKPSQAPPFFWAIVPVELDSPGADREQIHVTEKT